MLSIKESQIIEQKKVIASAQRVLALLELEAKTLRSEYNISNKKNINQKSTIRCQNGESCTYGIKCTYYHTSDEKTIFLKNIININKEFH